MALKLLPVTLIAGALLSGCSSSDSASTENSALEILKHYEATVKRNDKGRVVRVVLEHKTLEPTALEAACQLPDLRHLSLYGSSVTDDDLVALEGLRLLESIGLGKTRISDRGLQSLEKFTSLKTVWLPKNPEISQEQVERLQRVLPNLKVHWQKGRKDT